MYSSRNMTRMAVVAICLTLAFTVKVLAQNTDSSSSSSPSKSAATKSDQSKSATNKNASSAASSSASSSAANQGGRQRGRGGFDPTQMFDQFDTNKDGQLSKAELEAGMAQMRANRGNRGDRAGQGQGQGGDFGARMRQGMLDRMKEELGADDKEWTVLKPRLEKLMELQRSQRGGGFRPFGMGGRPPQMDSGNAPPAPPDGGPSDGPPGPPPDSASSSSGAGSQSTASTTTGQAETEALRKAIDDKNTKTDELKKKMEAYRAARKKQSTELDAARTQLRELLTTRQEAVLVLNGMLD